MKLFNLREQAVLFSHVAIRYLDVHHVGKDLLYPNRLLLQYVMFLPEALWVVEPQAKAL